MLISMRCSQEGCKQTAKLMYKDSAYEKDLRCSEDLALADCWRDYKPLGDYWPEIGKKIDDLENLVRQAQVLLSAISDQYYVTKLSVKEKKEIDLISRRLKRWVAMFPIKIYNLIEGENFDVFIEVHKEYKSVESDTIKLNQIFGPLLALIYSTSVLKQMNTQEMDNTEELEYSVANLYENGTDIFRKSNGALLLESEGTSDGENKFNPDISRVSSETRESTDFDLYEEEEVHWESSANTSMADLTSSEEFSNTSSSIVTVFAATSDDISSGSTNYKDLVDFMHEIRDSNLELRGEIDHYIYKNGLKPSQEYENDRVVPDIKEVTEILTETKIAMNGELDSRFKLILDLKKSKKQGRSFMREVKDYRMPRIHSLAIKNIHKIEPNDFNDYQRFMRHTMASDIREFFFHTGRELALAQFNHSIASILTLVNYQALFSNFILTNYDLTNIFVNLVKARHLEFEGGNFEMTTDDLDLTQMPSSHLESITINPMKKKISEEKVMHILRILCLSLRKTPVRETLKVLYIPKFMNIREVGTLFKKNRYNLKDIQGNM